MGGSARYDLNNEDIYSDCHHAFAWEMFKKTWPLRKGDALPKHPVDFASRFKKDAQVLTLLTNQDGVSRQHFSSG